jgi:hypothetical protein
MNETMGMHCQTTGKLIIALLLLTACTPLSAKPQSPSAPELEFPAPTTTNKPQPSARTMDELRAIIYASNPASPQYDPGSASYVEFPEAVKQLSALGPNAVDAAGDLADAITFPRQDSALAAQALLALGPDITSTAIVDLFENLDPGNLQAQKPAALVYTAILLGSTGDRATCAVGNIGPLLWNSDPTVRSAAAVALEKITGRDLVASRYEISITPAFQADSIPADTPQGSIVGAAREWWSSQGSKIKWHASYGLCDP